MKQILLIDDDDKDVNNTKAIIGEILDTGGNPAYGFLLDNGSNLGTVAVFRPNLEADSAAIHSYAVELIRNEIDNFDVLMIDAYLIGYKDEGDKPVSLQIIKTIVDQADAVFQGKLSHKKTFIVTGYEIKKSSLIYSSIYLDEEYRNRFTLLFRPPTKQENVSEMDNCWYECENENSDEKMCEKWSVKAYSGSEGAPGCMKKECTQAVFTKHAG